MKKQYLDAEDIATTIGISKSKAYKIIQQLNKELKEKGYLTVNGKVPTKFFLERTYGVGYYDEKIEK